MTIVTDDCNIVNYSDTLTLEQYNNMVDLVKKYRIFPFNFDIVNGWKTNIHAFYSYYTLVIS